MDAFIREQLDKSLAKLRRLNLSEWQISRYLDRQAKRYKSLTQDEIDSYLESRGLPPASR
jgi:hypothetical protein